MAELKKSVRTTAGLRDVLFEEIDSLRGPNGDATKSLAVANIAKQIINTAKVELEFKRTILQFGTEEQPLSLGDLRLGSE